MSIRHVLGTLYGLSAVSIWAGFILVSAIGVRTSLTPWDIAAIRFTVAGALLLPYLLRKGLASDVLGRGGLVAIAVGAGAPMVLMVNAGLQFAPASHAGALFPGVMPLFVAILSAALLGERPGRTQALGIAAILVGALGMVWASRAGPGSDRSLGHLLFLCASFAWACYTVAMRRAGLGGLHAAAIAAVASLVVYLPAYAVFAPKALLDAGLADVIVQAIVQGVLTAIVALWLYGRAIALLGATGGAAFVALTPAVTAVAAIPVLGEWPSATDWFAIAAISAGVYLVASSGPRRAGRAAGAGDD